MLRGEHLHHGSVLAHLRAQYSCLFRGGVLPSTPLGEGCQLVTFLFDEQTPVMAVTPLQVPRRRHTQRQTVSHARGYVPGIRGQALRTAPAVHVTGHRGCDGVPVCRRTASHA